MSSESETWKRHLDDLVIALATLVTFGRSVAFGLVESWDDGRFLVEFEPVHSVSFANLVAIWSEPHFEAFHPLHLMGYWLDVPLAGPNGHVIHTVNLVLWAGALMLLRRVFVGWKLGPVGALIATLTVGLHPAQVEAVVWATGRKEILALMFSAFAILAHLRSAKPTDRSALLSGLFYIGALLSKTTALPLPIVIVLADVLLRGIPWRQAAKQQSVALLLGAACAYGVHSIWTENQMIRPAPGGFARVSLVAATFTHYLSTLALPLDNSPVYPIHREANGFGMLDWAGPVLLALSALAFRKRKRVLFALGSFVVLLLPVANIVPVYFEVQDRYLSLPLVAVGFGVGATVVEMVKSRGKRLSVAFFGFVLALFAARTIHYQGNWSDDEALWGHATRTHPSAYYAWMKLGELRRDRGDYDLAIEAYQSGIDAHPTIRLGHGALLSAFAMRDEERHELPAQALNLAARYLRGADDADALRLLAGDMVVSGYRDAALLPLGRSLDIDPLAPERLEAAARVQEQNGNDWLVEFYRNRIPSDSDSPADSGAE